MTRPLAAIGLSVACAVALLASGAAAAPTGRDDTAATSAGGPAVGAERSTTASGRPSGPIGSIGNAAGIGATIESLRSPARDIDAPTGGPNNAPVANGRPADGGPVERIGE